MFKCPTHIFWRNLNSSPDETRSFDKDKVGTENLEKDFINVAAPELHNASQLIVDFSELLYSGKQDEEHCKLLAPLIINSKRLQRIA